MWDFAGEELPAELLAGCELVVDAVPDPVAALLGQRRVRSTAASSRQVAPKAPVPFAARRLPGLSLAARLSRRHEGARQLGVPHGGPHCA